MKSGKLFVTGLVVAALVSPAFAADNQVVRPTVKAVTANTQKQTRLNARAGANMKSSNAQFSGSGYLIPGLGGLLILGGLLALTNGKQKPTSP